MSKEELSESSSNLNLAEAQNPQSPPSDELVSRDSSSCINAPEMKENLHCYGFILFTPDYSKITYVVSQSGGLGFPKGKIEPGETPIMCAYRELKEETGIDETQFDLFNGVHFYERSHKKNISVGYFLGIIKNNNTLDSHIWSFDNEELSDAGLMDYEHFNNEMFSEAPRYKIKDTRIEMVRKIRIYVRGVLSGDL